MSAGFDLHQVIARLVDLPGRVLLRMVELGCDPRKVPRSGRSYRALCPVCLREDRTLEVNVGHDGEVDLRCWAGCGVKAIWGRLGMAP